MVFVVFLAVASFCLVAAWMALATMKVALVATKSILVATNILE